MEENTHVMPVVVMLVNNPCVNDSRVIKSAETVANSGRRVIVVCRQDGELPEDEERAGVRYIRIVPIPRDWRSLVERLFGRIKPAQSHLQKSSSASLHKKSEDKTVLYRVIRLFRARLLSLVRTLKRIVVRFLRPILRALYWFFESDEFGAGAEPYVVRLKPDVIHAHDLTTLPLAGRLSRKLGAKLIYDSHELEMHRNANYPWLVKLRRRWLESKYIRQADGVVTVSESIADHLRDDYEISRPVVVMNSPLFDSSVHPEKDLRTDLGLAADTPLAVYVGGVTVNRGVENIVRSLVYMPDLHFATVGPRRAATADEASEIAEKLGVRNRLHFIDPVMPEEVVSYIRTADLSLLPIQNVCLSYYYCMPNKLLESVFAGLPVAVANLAEMRRFVKEFECGVVMDETDPKDIARAVKEILAERERYILTQEGRDRLAYRYGWASQAERLNQLYDELACVASKAVEVRDLVV